MYHRHLDERGGSMAIKFSCALCGKKLTAKDELAGRRSKCPQCGSVVGVPFPSLDLFDEPPLVDEAPKPLPVPRHTRWRRRVILAGAAVVGLFSVLVALNRLVGNREERRIESALKESREAFLLTSWDEMTPQQRATLVGMPVPAPAGSGLLGSWVTGSMSVRFTIYQQGTGYFLYSVSLPSRKYPDGFAITEELRPFLRAGKLALRADGFKCWFVPVVDWDGDLSAVEHDRVVWKLQRVGTADHRPRIRNPKIPIEVSYPIVRDDGHAPGIRNVHVLLNQMVSRDVLREIALEIKGNETEQYAMTHIHFYLTDYWDGKERWAYARFDRTLEVRIEGTTPEARAKLVAIPVSLPPGSEPVGSWVPDEYRVRLTIYRQGSRYFLHSQSSEPSPWYPDGRTLEMRAIPRADGLELECQAWVHHFVIKDNGLLELRRPYDGDQVSSRAEPLR
jgi:hypothetical protein